MERRRAQLPVDHEVPSDDYEQHSTAQLARAVRRHAGTEYADAFDRQIQALHDTLLPPGGFDFEPIDTHAFEQVVDQHIKQQLLQKIATEHPALYEALRVQHGELLR